MIGKFKFISRYLNYFIHGQNRHHLQAPFIFQLNEAVFRKDKKDEVQTKIEVIRKQLLNDNRILNIRDFGAGFGGKVYHQRSVKFITKRSGKPAKYARLLFRLTNYFKPEYMLELGTSVGISALYQAAGNPKCKLITLEGCESTATIAEDNFRKFPEYSIQIIKGAFDQTLENAIEQLPRLDYVFIDGHHKLEPTLKYFELCLSKIHEHSIVVIDDINWSDEMREAWKKIISHTRVTVSINIFMMGIVFFNPDLSKENFNIRY
jgi:predicted O-methyltransferase YrrM